MKEEALIRTNGAIKSAEPQITTAWVPKPLKLKKTEHGDVVTVRTPTLQISISGRFVVPGNPFDDYRLTPG